MKLAKSEVCTLLVSILSKESHDLPLASHVVNLLCWTRRGAGCFTFRRFPIETAGFHEVFDCLFKCPATCVQINVDANSCSTIARQTQDLSLRSRVVRIETRSHQHLFGVKRPTFNKNSITMLTSYFILYVVRDR